MKTKTFECSEREIRCKRMRFHIGDDELQMNEDLLIRKKKQDKC